MKKSTLMNPEDFNNSYSSVIDAALRDELRELGLSSTIVVHGNNDFDFGDGSEHKYDSSTSFSGNQDKEQKPAGRRRSLSWGDESYLADLMQQRGQRESAQREEAMEVALERFNAIPDVNKKTGEEKNPTMFLKLVEEVQKELEEDFQKRNDLLDERIATEMLSIAQRDKKVKAEAEESWSEVNEMAMQERKPKSCSVDNATKREAKKKNNHGKKKYDIELLQDGEEFHESLDMEAIIRSAPRESRRRRSGCSQVSDQSYQSQLTSNSQNSKMSIDWAASGAVPSLDDAKHSFSDDVLTQSLNMSFSRDDEISDSSNDSKRESNNIKNTSKKKEKFGKGEKNKSTSVLLKGGNEQVPGTGRRTLQEEKRRTSNFWGRKEELDNLQSRFLATTTRPKAARYGSVDIAPKHVWITGVPGIGKSSLVETFLRQDDILRTKAIICRGSFEENWMDTSKPFPGIMSCFSDLVESFLNGKDIDREEWKEVLQDYLNDKNDIALLILLIPSLGILLDMRNHDTNYSFDKRDTFSFERLTRALRKILITTCEESRVIFSLDNVHWAGDDSLNLLKALLSTKNLKNFFFVGSYRSGVEVSHSLPKVKTELSALFGADIKLRGIDKRSAKSIVRSHLRQLRKESSMDTKTLNSFVDSWCTHSSGSNPLYLEHLLHLWYEQKKLKSNEQKWMLDLDTELPISLSNLIDERMEGLPSTHALVLQSAGLLGANDFRIESLMVAVRTLAESQNLVIDIDELQNILSGLAEKMLIEQKSEDRHAFAHDVIRVTVMSRIPGANKKKKKQFTLASCDKFEDTER